MSWGARTSYAEPFTKLLPYGLVGFAWVRKRHTPLRFAGPEGGQLSHPGPGHKLLCFRSKSIVTSPRSSLTHAGLFCPFSQINSLSCSYRLFSKYTYFPQMSDLPPSRWHLLLH